VNVIGRTLPLHVAGPAPIRWKSWAVMWGLWTTVAIAFACQFYVANSQLGRHVPWSTALIRSLADWYVFGAISFLPIEMARRFSLDGGRWKLHLLLHLGAGAFFSVAYVSLRSAIGLLHGWPDPAMNSLGASLPRIFFMTWHFNFLMYWVLVGASHALDYYRKFREHHLQALELERRLMEAKLHALQMQLNPHFLFNSLGAIAELMHRDVKAADRMITRLGELLRTSLDSSSDQTVSLRREIEFIRRYLEIEQTRFGSRLEVRYELPEDLLECQIPNLILQPLIENALKHGIEPLARGGRIDISARRESSDLILEVADNGRGLPEVSMGRPPREGIGTSNSRARLRELYGNRALLELTTQPGGGVLARIRISGALPGSGTGA